MCRHHSHMQTTGAFIDTFKPIFFSVLTKEDLDDGVYDLVLAMDNANYEALIALAGRPTTHIRIFSDYLDDNWPNDVPDPYYGDEEGFDEVLDMLEEGCPIILQTLAGEEIFDMGLEDT